MQEYPSTEDSLTALQQCLMKSQYHFQQHHETCLNFSSLVRGMQVAKLHGGEIQTQELSNFEQNITLTLCKDELLLSLPQKQGHTFRFQYRGTGTESDAENIFAYKTLALILISIYSLFTTYLIICFLGCKAGLQVRRSWRKNMLARSTKVIEPEEQEAAPSKANRKEAEHENIYQSMKKIGPPFHIYPCLPNALYPEANVYDTLPIHSGGVVGTQGEDVDEENIYVLAGSPISHLKKYQTLHRADLGSMTGKAEVSLLGRKPRRSNSLTLLTFILVLLVTNISAIPQVQDMRNSDTSESQGKETIHVQNGTSASILCRSFAQYGGVVTWSVKEGVLPENFQENNGYLIIDSVEKDLDLSCQVVAGFSTFLDDFKIIVTPAISLEEAPLPQYLEGYNCASSLTKPIVRSAAYTADCKVDDFAAYTSQPDRKFLLLGRERVVKAEAKRCFITIEVSRAICERKIVSGFTKMYQGLYDTSLSQCKELHDTGKTNLLVHR
ncbi:MAG: hypothetical protein AAFO91_06015, partial [Bacteroidota bacterium]